MKIGVVIPTLEEETVIERTLAALLERGKPDVIVVADCGSRDRTAALARRFEAVVVMSSPALDCRSAAMNVGAAAALRQCPDLDALWFVHADSTVPHEWAERIAEALADERIVGGAFDIRWDIAGVGRWRRVKLAAFQALNRVRFRLTRIYFGDQGIFMRRTAFETVGGMPPMTLMEDVVLCRRLKRLGRLRLAAGVMLASPRRFMLHGVCRQVLIDTWLLAAERLGFTPRRLHAWYNQEKA